MLLLSLAAQCLSASAIDALSPPLSDWTTQWSGVWEGALVNVHPDTDGLERAEWSCNRTLENICLTDPLVALDQNDCLDCASRAQAQLQGICLQDEIERRCRVVPTTVRMEIGPLPNTDRTCTTWRQHFIDSHYPPMTKDYRLCRGANVSDIYVDEGGGVKLLSRWAGEELLSYFSVAGQVLFTTQRIREDGAMIEEILTSSQPSEKPSLDGVESFMPGTVQRFGLRRTGECTECVLTPAGAPEVLSGVRSQASLSRGDTRSSTSVQDARARSVNCYTELDCRLNGKNRCAYVLDQGQVCRQAGCMAWDSHSRAAGSAGACLGGSCVCDKGWTGNGCELLDVEPATVAYGFNASTSPSTSCWGGGPPHKDPNGQFHLFVTELANSCGMSTWGRMSQATHAVADTLAGPYKKVDIALPTESHNVYYAYSPVDKVQHTEATHSLLLDLA